MSSTRRTRSSLAINANDAENVSPARENIKKPVSPVFSAVKVKSMVEAINLRQESVSTIAINLDAAILQSNTGEVSEKGEDEIVEELGFESKPEDLEYNLLSDSDNVEDKEITKNSPNDNIIVYEPATNGKELPSAPNDHVFTISAADILPPMPPVDNTSIHVTLSQISTSSEAIASVETVVSSLSSSDSALISATSMSNNVEQVTTVKNSRLVAKTIVNDSLAIGNNNKQANNISMPIAPATNAQRSELKPSEATAASSLQNSRVRTSTHLQQSHAKSSLNAASVGNVANALPKSRASVKTDSTLPANVKPITAKCTERPTTATSFESRNQGLSARDAARIAKEAATADRIKKVAELRTKWKEERTQKISANKANRETELIQLKQLSNKASEQRRIQLETQRKIQDEEKQRLKLSLQEKHTDRLKQAETLQRQAKDAQRKLALQKQKDAKAIAEAEMQQEQQRKQELADMLQTRRDDHLLMKEAKKLDEEEQRQAMVARGASALQQKEIAAKLLEVKKKQEADLMDIRKQNREDDRKVKENQRRSRRESLSGRLDAWRSQRAVEKKLQDNENQRVLDQLNSRHDDWQAVQAYKNDEASQRRQSLAGRLDKWRAERKQCSEQQEQAEEAQQLERELKNAEIEDIKKHHASLASNRRESLAQRLDKARQDHDKEQAQQAVRKELEDEARRIAEQDREDVRKHKSMVLAARRQVRLTCCAAHLVMNGLCISLIPHLTCKR